MCAAVKINNKKKVQNQKKNNKNKNIIYTKHTSIKSNVF